MNKRILYWDNLKGVLILLVVFGHSIEFFIDKYVIFKNLWLIIYSFHMPLFIFMNGIFLKKYNIHKKNKKIKKLFTLYFILQAILSLIYCLFNSNVAYSLFYPQFGLWYIIFLCYAILISSFVGKENRLVWLISSIILSLTIGIDGQLINAFAVSKFLFYLPFFILGYAFYTEDILKYIKAKKRWLYVIFILTATLIWIINTNYLIDKSFVNGSAPGPTSMNISQTMFLSAKKIMAFIIIILMSSSFLSLIPNKKTFLTTVGQETLTIYSYHLVVTVFIYELFKHYHLVGKTLRADLFTIIFIGMCNIGIYYLLKFIKRRAK